MLLKATWYETVLTIQPTQKADMKGKHVIIFTVNLEAHSRCDAS